LHFPVDNQREKEQIISVMKTEQNFKTRMGWLKHKFDYSGISGNPRITIAELMELQNWYEEVAEFFDDTGNRDMSQILWLREEQVNSTLHARENQ